MGIFDKKLIDLDVWIQNFVDPVALWLRPFFQALKWPIEKTLSSFEVFLIRIPHPAFLVVAGLIVWQLTSFRLAALVVLGFICIGVIGVWKAAMTTLSLIITAVFFCILSGIPIGVLCAKSRRIESFVRPILDVMQTLPAFVYLVPIVMLMGIGNVPGVIVTIVFALPPIIRLTNLGLREVPANLVEAAFAFGSTPSQVLLKIQMPLAMRTIMTGVNQTLMMALAMTVISSMIAVDGLGMIVLRGIGRLDLGLATVGGIGIVILALMLDRVTQYIGAHSDAGASWLDRRPIGFARLMLKRIRTSGANDEINSNPGVSSK